MRVLEFDASKWASGLDMYRDVLGALGEHDHACNINALGETLVWSFDYDPKMPPLRIIFRNLASAPPDARQEARWLHEYVVEHTAYRLQNYGERIDVSVELA